MLNLDCEKNESAEPIYKSYKIIAYVKYYF